jgi:nicotinate-nucleotide pyrophosphorylase (carboxylating)
LPVAEAVFREIDPGFSWTAKATDGERVAKGQTVAELHGRLRSILAGERLALNFLQRMSGIATLTRRYVDAVAGTKARILDTRKTVPGLRVLDKYAVRMGGGYNHRFGLYDGVILKDNHIRAAGGVGQAVERLRQTLPPGFKIEVEVGSLAEVEAALKARAEIVMLDNMSTQQMAEAVRLIAGRALVEASGGITLETVRAVAASGVDFISVGALTHSPPALDISLEITS